MIIVGELLNSSRKAVREAVKNSDADYIKRVARKQQEAGASYLDVNAGAFAEEEPEKLQWMIECVRSETDMPLCVDSPKPDVIRTGCDLAGGGDILINSISAESERYEALIPVIKEHQAKVIALAMDDSGMIDDEDRMFDIASGLVDRLTGDGVSLDRIFLDPLIRPIATDSRYGNIALNLMRRVREAYPDIHIICGLSNVSFGLPKRKIINRALALLAMEAGLDAAILDPLDKVLKAQILAAEVLLGRDDFCMNYIGAARSGEFDDI